MTFYTRELPHAIVSFTAKKSKELLVSAITVGTAEVYFSLAQQYLTQSEPAYCGIATLCMILNASSIDPHQTWKGVWRWFDQDMLNCCRPLASIQAQGVTMSEFVCLARCNALQADSKHGVSMDQFRADVIKSCSSRDTFLAVSYSRKSLGQTGTGHFSPIAAYVNDGNEEWVLVLDVARFKYPAYWCSLALLHAAMDTIDDVSGSKRGYAVLRKDDKTYTSVLHIELNKLSVRCLIKAAQKPNWSIPEHLKNKVRYANDQSMESIDFDELLRDGVNNYIHPRPSSPLVNEITNVIKELIKCCDKELCCS